MRLGTAAGLLQDVVLANFFINTSSITVIIGLDYESLIRYPNDRVLLTPRLATEQASDGKSITLWLRQESRPRIAAATSDGLRQTAHKAFPAR